MGKLNDLAVNAYKYSQKIPVVDKIVNAAVRHPSTAARIGMYGLAALTGATIVAAADTSLVGAEGFTPPTPTPPPPPPPPPENHNKGGIGNGSAGLEDVILQSTNAGPVAAGIAAVAGIATGAIHIRNKHKARYQLGNSEVGISYRKESNVFDQYMKAENGAGLKNIVGGEVKTYTKMTMDARDEAYNRMVNDAIDLKADAIIGVRFTTSMVMAGASEMLAFGTAVKIK